MTTRTLSAIHPRDPKHEIRNAYAFKDHFGPGKHSINFGGINTPHYSFDLISWEFLSDKPEDRIEWLLPKPEGEVK